MVTSACASAGTASAVAIASVNFLLFCIDSPLWFFSLPIYKHIYNGDLHDSCCDCGETKRLSRVGRVSRNGVTRANLDFANNNAGYAPKGLTRPTHLLQ